MSWESEMVRLLVEQRSMGVVDFALAWRRAQALCPLARPRDFYGRRPADDPEWQPYSTFFREACRAEWLGRVTVDYVGLRDLFADGGGSRAASHAGESGRAHVVLLG